MPELPDPKSKTTSSPNLSFNMNCPVWHQLSGNILQSQGWARIGNEYHKEGLVMKYDGVHFKIGEIRFQWVEELNEYLKQK